MSDYDRQTFVYSEAARGRNRISFAPSIVARHIGILSVSNTHSSHYIFRFIFSSPICARESARPYTDLPRLSIAEALSAVIGPWCRTMGQTMHGTIHPPLLDYPALSHPGHPPPTFLPSSTSLLESAHPRQLNKHNSWLCRPVVTMRAPRKEIPKIRGTGIVCPALSPSPSSSFAPSFPAERIICRRAVAHLPFTKELLWKKERRERDLCYLDDERRRDSLLVIIKWYGVNREIIIRELSLQLKLYSSSIVIFV